MLQAYAQKFELEIELVIDSSRQLRAWQTATLIAELLGTSFRVEEFPDLAERSVGAVANLTVAEIEALFVADPRYSVPPAGWKSDSHYRLPFQDAESLLDAGSRVAGHIERRYQQLPAKGMLKVIVGHGASIRHACVRLGVLDFEDVAKVSMHHARPVYICCQSDGWQRVGGEWKKRSSGGDEIREGH
jgi:2,3-bisphosphoglycerate-dependent phosphoglycerate mutase